MVLVLGFGFCGNPADSGWGLGWVCFGTGFGFSPPFLAGACGVCKWTWLLACTAAFLAGFWGVRCGVRVPPVPRHSWPGCAVSVCVFGWGCGCAPPLLAGVLGGVRVCVRALCVPRHSWLGCAVWLYVPGLKLWLRPAIHGWGAEKCVCLCARSACTPPLLAGVCGVGVCACARVPAVPRQSWLGCWGVSVFVYVLRLYPAIPGGMVCVCVG